MQSGQAGKSGSKIVESNLNPERLQAMDRGARGFEIVDDGAFGDFDLDGRDGGSPGQPRGLLDLVDMGKLSVLEIGAAKC